MIQKDAFKIIQDKLAEQGITMSLEDIKLFMRALEEACVVIGDKLDIGEVCRIVNFLEIRKKENKPRNYRVMKGEDTGKIKHVEGSINTTVKSTKAFTKRTKK
jgi:hypothetical protein